MAESMDTMLAERLLGLTESTTRLKDAVDHGFEDGKKRMDGIVEMIQTNNKKLEDHEEKIKTLEGAHWFSLWAYKSAIGLTAAAGVGGILLWISGLWRPIVIFLWKVI